jgi:hypothetical protein
MLRHLQFARIACVSVAAFVMLSPASAKEFDHAAICEAIKNEWKILLIYRQSESAAPPREVVPRFLGKTKADNVLMNGLQIAGFSETGKIPGHRSFRLDRASAITFTKDHVPVGTGSGRLPSGVVTVICER